MKTIKNLTHTTFFAILFTLLFAINCGGGSTGDPPDSTDTVESETKDTTTDKADQIKTETTDPEYDITGTWVIWQVEKDLSEAMPQVGSTQVKIKMNGTKIVFEDLPGCVGDLDDDYFYVECSAEAHFWYFYDGNVKETEDGDLYIETSRINMVSGAPEKEFYATFVPMDFCEEKNEKSLLVVDQSPDCTTQDFMAVAIAIPGQWEDSDDGSTFMADLHKAEEGDSNYEEIKKKCPDTDYYIQKFGITGIICLEENKQLTLCKNNEEACDGNFVKEGTVDFDNSHLISKFTFTFSDGEEKNQEYIKKF